MNEAENDDRPIYALADDKDNFQLFTMSIAHEPGGSYRIKRTPCTAHKLYEYWLKTQHEDINFEQSYFYLSCLVLTASEKIHRDIIQRITKKSSKNIKTKTERPVKYLRTLLISITNSKNDKMDDKKTIKNIKELDSLLKSSFYEIRSLLGFPHDNPYEYSYNITNEIISSARDKSCVEYLIKLNKNHINYISSEKFDEICEDLNSRHKDDAKKVISELQLTKSREHLAVFSLSNENDQIFINIVNYKKEFLKLESWKFLKLLEDSGNPLRLHEFEKRKSYATDTIFQFNLHREGMVVGKFDAGKSCLWVSCLTNGQSKDQAAFILDLTYTLCMYVTLKRLEEDKHRFSQLRDNSTMAPAARDPFEHLSNPFFENLRRSR